MDTRHGLVVLGPAAVVVGLGAAAWALAATAMSAVHAAEARALGPGHTAEMPGEDELALLAHDLRLAAMVVVACGVAVACTLLPRWRAGLVWSAAVVTLVVANATLGRAVDGWEVPPAATALAVLTGAATAVAALVAARRLTTTPGDDDRRWPLVGVSVLAAGTLPVLGLQGTGSARYAPWVPADLVTSNLVSALALALVVVVAAVLLARSAVDVVVGVVLPVAALVVLLEPSGATWQVREQTWVPGVVLVLAAAPLLLGVAARRSDRTRRRVFGGVVLVASGGLLAAVPQVLVLPVVVGGLMGMLLTAPAGAYISYDGLPVVGGGAVLASALLVLHLCTRPGAGPSPGPTS